MRTRKLMAIKAHRYGTRHLTAGEEYEAPHGHAIALVAVKKARFVPDKKPTAPPKAPPEASLEVREAAERETAEREAGDKPRAVTAASAPVTPPETADAKTIDSLRLQATQLGIDVDGRWGVVRLQYEISQRQR
jgi:hypothetical protein